MAVEQHQSLLDSLRCEEEDDDGAGAAMPPEKDSPTWDDEELQALFSRQDSSSAVGGAAWVLRKETVEWVLRISSRFGFSASTAILAVGYLDRFLSSISYRGDKPWMIQLAAVASLSIAAKVAETASSVPLLLDLQVEGAKYFFEAKTIQRMELLILRAMEWRVNSATPLCFIDHAMRRLGMKSDSFWGFCENLLLGIISDSRSRWFPPSVLAGATMIHVSRKGTVDFLESQLLSLLKISKEELKRCYDLVSDILSNACRKRGGGNIVDSSSSSISSSDSIHHRPLFKKPRVREESMRLHSFEI